MVPFWNEEPQASTLASSALTQDKWPLPKDWVCTPSESCLVEVAAPTTESVPSVKIVIGLLGPFLSMEKVVTSSNTATLFQIKYQARDSALLAHRFNYRGISARCLESDHVYREKVLKPHVDDKHPNNLIAVFPCGGALGAGTFVTQIMDLQAKLEMPPPDPWDKFSNWNTEENTDPGTPLSRTTPTEPPSPTHFPTIGSEGPVPTDKDRASSELSPPPLTQDTPSSLLSHQPSSATSTLPKPQEVAEQPQHPTPTLESKPAQTAESDVSSPESSMVNKQRQR